MRFLPLTFHQPRRLPVPRSARTSCGTLSCESCGPTEDLLCTNVCSWSDDGECDDGGASRQLSRQILAVSCSMQPRP